MRERGLNGSGAPQMYVAQCTAWLGPAVPCHLYLRVLTSGISVCFSPQCIDRTSPDLQLKRKHVATTMKYPEINPNFQSMLKFRFYFLVTCLVLRSLLNHQHSLCVNISKSTRKASCFTNGSNLLSMYDTSNNANFIRHLN